MDSLAYDSPVCEVSNRWWDSSHRQGSAANPPAYLLCLEGACADTGPAQTIQGDIPAQDPSFNHIHKSLLSYKLTLVLVQDSNAVVCGVRREGSYSTGCRNLQPTLCLSLLRSKMETKSLPSTDPT